MRVFQSAVFKIQCRFKISFSLVHQGLSEPEFYGDLVYKFKKIMGSTDFSDQFRKVMIRHKRICYNLNVMQQSACLATNPITVYNFFALFNCTPVNRASDSMMARLKAIRFSWFGSELFLLLLGSSGLDLCFFCFRFSVVLFGSQGISNCHATRCIC